ncbi:MAG: hypothetical protein WC205_02980 [Opitutaceae bacterium]|jgi:hypothetical protein
MNTRIVSLLGALVLVPLTSCWADTLWLSAIDATATTPQVALIGAAKGVEANGTRILQLQSFVEGPHQVSFKFSVKKSGTYKIWAATTPQTSGWASPFLVLLDGKPMGTATDQSIALQHSGPVYGFSNNPGLFQWYLFGEKLLTSGEHQVAFRITTRRATKEAQGQAFAFYFDTLLVTDTAALVPSGADAKETTAK